MQPNNKQQNPAAGVAALYCRLSREDGGDGESNSIENQKKLLGKYAAEHGFPNTRLYVDDGYTGTNFNRPGFQEMLKDIGLGYVNTVIVKDSSRFGRNYIEVGKYLEIEFPNAGVRFISVTEGIDSADGEDELGGFRSIINEFYAKDISRKVRASHRLKGTAGIPLSPPPYGYIKDPADKGRWIIDPEAAVVVRRIFSLASEGKGNETIARMLQEDKVLTPTAYWRGKGLGRGGKKTQPDPYKWGHTTVKKILAMQEYCGDVINFKTYSKSFRNKQRFANADADKMVFFGVHEPVIDRETWEQVQKFTKNTKRRPPKPGNGEKSMFCDLLYCADCGSKLWFNVNHPNDKIRYFNCSNYRGNRGTCDSTHYIREDALEAIVGLELRRLVSLLKSDEERFTAILEKECCKDAAERKRSCESVIAASTARLAEIVRICRRLYEDNLSGKVADKMFAEMSAQYAEEEELLRSRITESRRQLAEMQEAGNEKDSFLTAIRRFMEMETLTPQILRELIDKIVVYQAEGLGKNRTQHIEIHYRFIGTVDVPAGDEPNVKLDTRRGVAIEYRTQSA